MYALELSVLFAIGTSGYAKIIAPKLLKILGKKELKYPFVSHMASDEVDGLPIFLEIHPNVTITCNALAARELNGYGITGKVLVKKAVKQRTLVASY